MALVRPERPLQFRPGNDCNGLVTGRRLGNLNERRFSDITTGSSRPTAVLHKLLIEGIESGLSTPREYPLL